MPPHLDATRFVTLVCGLDAPTVQVFADSAQADVRPEHRTGDLADLWPWVTRQQAKGAGVFLTINRTTPGTRKGETVDLVRALFVDFDGVEPQAWHLPPSILVQSAHGKHAYWLLADPLPPRDFPPAQKRLAAHYGSDPKVHDLPRVMRLPGTLHQKALPQRVVILADPGHRYAAATVLSGIASLQTPIRTAMPSMASDPTALHGDYKTLDLAALFTAQGAHLRDLGDGKHAVVCPWWSQHTGQRQGETSTIVWQDGVRWPRFYCAHAHCAGKRLADVAALFGPDTLARFCAVARPVAEVKRQWRQDHARAEQSERERGLPWLQT